MGVLSIKRMWGAINRKRGFGKELDRSQQPELPWVIGEGMDFIRGAPCHFPTHLEDEAEVIDEWLQGCKCSERHRKRILSCLDVTYLRRLPVVGKSRPWPKSPTNRNFRYHFRAQASHVLGWTVRTAFPEHIDELIRRVWPDNVDAVEFEVGRQGGRKCKTSIAQSSHATSREKEDDGGSMEKQRGDGEPAANMGNCAGGARHATIVDVRTREPDIQHAATHGNKETTIKPEPE